MLLATAACNFWFLLWPHDSAPAALTSLLFDSPDTRIIGKTQRFATPLTFGADVSSFFWLSRNCIFFLLTLLHLICFSSAFQLSILSEVYYLNFLRSCQYRFWNHPPTSDINVVFMEVFWGEPKSPPERLLAVLILLLTYQKNGGASDESKAHLIQATISWKYTTWAIITFVQVMYLYIYMFIILYVYLQVHPFPHGWWCPLVPQPSGTLPARFSTSWVCNCSWKLLTSWDQRYGNDAEGR